MTVPKFTKFSIKAYKPGKSNIGKIKNIIKLSANESALGVSRKVKKVLNNKNLILSKYPDSNSKILRKEIAKKFNLPVIMHVRGAIDLVLKNLRQIKVRGGIAHAFNGSFQQADQLIKLGFKLGFGGAMTYPRAKHLQSLAKELPIESIVLETDSPDMPPAWLNNGERNQPKELGRIAEFFCHLRGLKPSKTMSFFEPL